MSNFFPPAIFSAQIVTAYMVAMISLRYPFISDSLCILVIYFSYPRFYRLEYEADLMQAFKDMRNACTQDETFSGLMRAGHLILQDLMGHPVNGLLVRLAARGYEEEELTCEGEPLRIIPILFAYSQLKFVKFKKSLRHVANQFRHKKILTIRIVQPKSQADVNDLPIASDNQQVVANAEHLRQIMLSLAERKEKENALTTAADNQPRTVDNKSLSNIPAVRAERKESLDTDGDNLMGHTFSPFAKYDSAEYVESLIRVAENPEVTEELRELLDEFGSESMAYAEFVELIRAEAYRIMEREKA